MALVTVVQDGDCFFFFFPLNSEQWPPIALFPSRLTLFQAFLQL